MNIFKDKKQALLKIDETHLLKKIMNTFETNEKIDKENIPPLKLLNKYKSVKTIRTLREGVVNKKEKA